MRKFFLARKAKVSHGRVDEVSTGIGPGLSEGGWQLINLSIVGMVASKVSSWISLQRDIRLRAIDGLTPAVAATVRYTERLKAGAIKDLTSEDQIHDLWVDASSRVAEFDKQLAHDCMAKAKYWLFSEDYTDGKIDELNIRLVRMQAELEKMKYQ